MALFRKIVFLLLPLVCFYFAKTSANNLSKVKQFNRIDYEAASQNWSVSSSESGKVYFANHKGLLEFDGSTWKLHKLPNQNIMRAVKAVSDSLIYTSGFQELGFWKRDKFGQLHYHSLNAKAKQLITNNIEFWNIVISDNSVYFHSFSDVLCYTSDSVFRVSTPGFSSVLSHLYGKALLAVKDQGIYELAENNTKPFIVSDFFKGKLIRFILPYKNQQMLFGTEAAGVFIWDGKIFRQWKEEWKEYFIANELNRAHYSVDGSLTFGSIIDGVILFDKNEDFVQKVNAQNGLSNNTVLGLEIDKWGNRWMALDNGIGFISSQKDESISFEPINRIGAIYSTAIVGNKKYYGTNQGLFVQMANEKPVLVPQMQGQIWECKVIDGKLWVGHNQGTYQIIDGKAKRISNISGGASIKPDQINGNYIQGTYTGLVYYSKDVNGKIQSKKINGFTDLVRYLEVDHLNNIWVSHMHLGVYKIVTDDERNNVTNAQYFGDETFGQNHSIHVFKVENRIVFTTGNQLFTYDDLKDSIITHKQLNMALGEFKTAHRIIQAPNHHYWFISQKSIGLYKIQNDNITLIKAYPTSLFQTNPLVDTYENILPINETNAILCLQKGIAKLDGSQQKTENILQNYKPEIRLLVSRNNKNHEILLPNSTSNFQVKHAFNTLRINFSFPYYSGLPLLHQYFLEGLDVDWSEPVTSPSFDFERLPFGTYILKIRSLDSWENTSKTLELPFEVLPPWYFTKIAWVLYFLFLLFVLIAFRQMGIKQTKRKQQRKYEKREKEIIKLRNEKLRSEIQFKSKDLANSTMSMIKKNEFLLELKNSIEKQKNELGSRYPDKYYNHLNKKIDENISNQDDWQVFETNFERAHEQFSMKMKASFSELTSSDLRLCAYLRMNLSSKEIAPLLGISVRGVENHRYRLRKKMNLQHDDSLTDRILSV